MRTGWYRAVPMLAPITRSSEAVPSQTDRAHLVSISGAPWSGKSTLWTGLASILGARPHTHFILDRPRRALALLGNDLAQSNLRGFQDYIGIGQLVAEEDARSSATLVICDKSMIDAVAYWRTLIGAPPPSWASKLTHDRYDLTVLCPHDEISTEPEGLARIHAPLRQQLAETVRDIATSSSQVLLEVSGQRDERVAMVIDEIERTFPSRGLLPTQ